MFFKNQLESQKEKYEKLLSLIGSLSYLFSDSKNPFLYYRIAERVFCQAFDADDLSREDISFDAQKDFLGIGLKTFLKRNGLSFEKVAEFNSTNKEYKDLSFEEKIIKIAQFRNERISFAKKSYNISNSIYHCVIRDEKGFYLHEENFEPVDIHKISNIKINNKNTVINFSDRKAKYKFNLTKSTLFKQFDSTKSLDNFIPIKILSNPLLELEKVFNSATKKERLLLETIYLPLYSTRPGKKYGYVPEKSQINQWNANGRKRDIGEVYLSVPALIHKRYENFFPEQNKTFNLHLPNKEILSAKICQENGKALMTNPNKALAQWLLRDVLSLEEGEILTNERLEILDIDSVKIEKVSNQHQKYKISFAQTGSYEYFKENS